jgi:membrane protease YdiL (CAAX protease family)
MVAVGNLIYLAPEVPAFIIVVLAYSPWVRPRQMVWLLSALVYLLLDGVVTIEGDFHLGSWNWTGKAASVLLALLCFVALRARPAESALQLPRTPTAWQWSVIGLAGAAVFAGAVSYYYRDHGPPNAEALLFEATMPGLAEELAWRGVLYLLLLRAYTDADGVMRAGPVALITTLIFGLGHGFNMDHHRMNFAWLPFAYATIFGGWLAFLRLRTRSLAALIVSHNVSNVCTLLVNGLP